MGLGIITEQGNLGLGFRPIKKSEEKSINENLTEKKESENKKTDDNSSNK